MDVPVSLVQVEQMYYDRVASVLTTFCWYVSGMKEEIFEHKPVYVRSLYTEKSMLFPE